MFHGSGKTKRATVGYPSSFASSMPFTCNFFLFFSFLSRQQWSRPDYGVVYAVTTRKPSLERFRPVRAAERTRAPLKRRRYDQADVPDGTPLPRWQAILMAEGYRGRVWYAGSVRPGQRTRLWPARARSRKARCLVWCFCTNWAWLKPFSCLIRAELSSCNFAFHRKSRRYPFPSMCLHY
jgi:hypothetical protein